MHGTARAALVVHVMLCLAADSTLRRLLLRDAHVLRLHHVGRHAQRFLVVRHAANRSDLRLLDVDHVQRFFRWGSIVNILVCCLLTTKIGIVIAQSVEHFAEGLVQPRVGLVHAGRLRVVLAGVRVLPAVLLRMVLLNDVRQLFSLQVMRHLACNLPFLNLWLILLGIRISLLRHDLFVRVGRDADGVGVPLRDHGHIDLLLLRGHPQLLVLALGEHLIELVEEDRVRLNALMVIDGLGLAVGWSV